jgi:hypothetical protein
MRSNLGARATEARVKALSKDGTLARARVVHFATHGLVAGETDAQASATASGIRLYICVRADLLSSQLSEVPGPCVR